MDMNQCKKGDKLLLRSGEIATLVEGSLTKTLEYPYILDVNGVEISVTKEGLHFVDYTAPLDVIGFAKEKTELIDKVLETIKADVINGDVTAIEELLKNVPIESLKSYLPEE